MAQVLRVRSRLAGSHAAEVLHDGDMLLAVRGQPVVNVQAVEALLTASLHNCSPKLDSLGACTPDLEAGISSLELASGKAEPYQEPAEVGPVTGQPPAGTLGKGSRPGEAVPLTILHNGQVEDVVVHLAEEDGLGTDRLVHWCGAQLQVCGLAPLRLEGATFPVAQYLSACENSPLRLPTRCILITKASVHTACKAA